MTNDDEIGYSNQSNALHRVSDMRVRLQNAERRARRHALEPRAHRGLRCGRRCFGTYPNLERVYTPLAYQHCESPACLRVCPTGATYKDDKGRVEIDYDKCIGCRMCMAACPYNARVFNWSEPKRTPDFVYGDASVPTRQKGVMEKCTLCKERTDRGEEPMCVACCPAKARIYGDLDDPASEISQVIAKRHAYVLLEEQGTHPQVHYFN